jgi:hypothetical protein
MREILTFHLQTHRQISEAIRRFGISATSTSLIMVRIGAEDRPPSTGRLDADRCLADNMSELVQGEMMPCDLLSDSADWMRVTKVCHLPGQCSSTANGRASSFTSSTMSRYPAQEDSNSIHEMQLHTADGYLNRWWSVQSQPRLLLNVKIGVGCCVTYRMQKLNVIISRL